MDADIKDALNQQHNMIQRVLERLDALPSIFVTRQEYSPRHDDLDEKIKELRLEFIEFKKSIEEKQHNAFSSGVAVLVAVGSALVTIVLHFWR